MKRLLHILLLTILTFSVTAPLAVAAPSTEIEATSTASTRVLVN